MAITDAPDADRQDLKSGVLLIHRLKIHLNRCE
jgi:hypothetical protein